MSRTCIITGLQASRFRDAAQLDVLTGVRSKPPDGSVADGQDWRSIEVQEAVVRRVRIAFLIAPLVAVLAVWVGFYLLVSRTGGEPIPQGAASHTLFFFVFFGTPAAYAIAGLAGIPVVRWLERTGRLRLLPLVLIGAAAGAVGLTIIWDAFWGSWVVELPTVAIGAAAGALAAGTFWVVGVRPPR